jgi:predicted peptidase
MKSLIILAILFFGLNSNGYCQWQNRYEKQVFISGTDSLLYRIAYPKNFDSTKTYPLILFLHGSGERGNDNEKQLVHMASYFASDSIRALFEFITIFPQCEENDYWGSVNRREIPGGLEFDFLPFEKQNKSPRLATELIEQFQKKNFVNKKKIYLSGLSMGGIGSFDILYRKPNMFAAALIICGGGNPNYVSNYAKKVPLWIFHGDKDNTVKTEYALTMAEAIKKSGGNPKVTIFPGVGHNAWDYVPKEPKILNWLLKKVKR